MEETVVKEAMETTAAVAQDAAQEVANQTNPVKVFVIGGIAAGVLYLGYRFYKSKKNRKSVEPAKPAQANAAEAVEPEVVNNEEEVKPENLN